MLMTRFCYLNILLIYLDVFWLQDSFKVCFEIWGLRSISGFDENTAINFFSDSLLLTCMYRVCDCGYLPVDTFNSSNLKGLLYGKSWKMSFFQQFPTAWRSVYLVSCVSVCLPICLFWYFPDLWMLFSYVHEKLMDKSSHKLSRCVNSCNQLWDHLSGQETKLHRTWVIRTIIKIAAIN